MIREVKSLTQAHPALPLESEVWRAVPVAFHPSEIQVVVGIRINSTVLKSPRRTWVRAPRWGSREVASGQLWASGYSQMRS